MSENVASVTVLIFAAVFLALGTALVYTCGYKAGQIDALTGRVQYRLVDKQDGTRQWEDLPTAAETK